MASKPWVGVGIARVLSVCRLSVTIVNWGQTVRGRPMVTMRHYLEVDIGLSESATKFDLGWPSRGNSKVTKVKWPVLSKRLFIDTGCLWTKMFTIAQLINVHLALWPWWPLGVISRSRMWNRLYLLDGARLAYGYYETLLGSWYRTFRIHQKIDLGWPWRVILRSRKWKWPVSSKRLLLGPGCI